MADDVIKHERLLINEISNYTITTLMKNIIICR